MLHASRRSILWPALMLIPDPYPVPRPMAALPLPAVQKIHEAAQRMGLPADLPLAVSASRGSGTGNHNKRRVEVGGITR